MTHTWPRRAVLSLTAAPLAAWAQSPPDRAPADRAPDWPVRVTTMLIPFGAGGPSDITGRSIAQAMSTAIGQPVVAENRPGANGEIAGRAMARAAPDGYTLMTGSIGVFAINAALRPNLGYDPVRDFTPITLAVTTPNVLVVNPDRVPARTLPELITWLRANPGRTSYSTSGVGSSDHLTAELFKQRIGADTAHIPYGGGAAAATDLIAGNVQISFQNLGTVAGHLAGGRLRAILQTGPTRSAVIPDVPTAAEAGLPDFVVTSWQAVMAPGGMAPALRDKLAAAVIAALKTPLVTERLGNIGLTVVANTPEEYSAFQQAEIARWRGVIAAANIRPE